MAGTPSVEAVRPATCPGCGAASRPVQGRLVLHGHGLRERQLRRVQALGEAPALLTIQARRYACQRCGAILLVVPLAVGPRRLFDLATIAFALARWLADGVASRAVREEVSPLCIVGDSARRAWGQLRRWRQRAVEICVRHGQSPTTAPSQRPFRCSPLSPLLPRCRSPRARCQSASSPRCPWPGSARPKLAHPTG